MFLSQPATSRNTLSDQTAHSLVMNIAPPTMPTNDIKITSVSRYSALSPVDAEHTG